MTARFSLSLVCLLTICAANSFGQYIDNQISNQNPAAQPATAWITGEYRTNAAFRLTREGADIIQTGLIMKNTANDKGVNLQLTGDAVPGLGIWIVSSAGVWNERMRITESVDVGIGTTAPGSYKLAVEGTIGARKVKVTQASWADFVFRPGYELRSLQEVERFVNQHQHLPDVPSEKEIIENGLDLGEMNKKLLQKVEELTLYLIQQQKLNEAQSERIAALEAVIKNMKK